MLLLGVTPAHVIPSGRQSGPTTQSRAELQRSGDARGLLDGLVFSGPTGASGMGADHQEKVVFNNGTFRSVASEEWGFEQDQYRRGS